MRKSVRAILLALVLIPASFTPLQAQQSGQVNVNSQVAGPPPSTPATITKPSNGARFIKDIIEVEGTCTPYVTVEVYTNNLLAGSAPCLSGGTFGLQIQLVPSQNVLVAKQRDSLDQYGPDSAPVTAYYDVSTVSPTPGGSVTPTTGTPTGQIELFRLLTDVVYRGARTNKSTLITIDIVGGLKPYAISIDWGDGVYELISRSDLGLFGQGHVYSKPGQYIITIKGKDKAGKEAFIQTYAVVTGDASTNEQTPTYEPSFLERVVNEVWHWTWWILLLLLVLLSGYRLGKHRGKK